ncbi:MAG: hypothetical protein HC913_15735 [Microscillaceae bacterium]|nr:hypothetical protein [Microscillaceae bacterium]
MSYIFKITSFAGLLLVWGGAEVGAQDTYRPFSRAEMGTIYEGTSTAAMRVLKITHYADSVFLRGKAQPVKPDPQDSVLRYFCKDFIKRFATHVQLGLALLPPR